MSQTYPPAQELLPHRDPILLVDGILSVDYAGATAEVGFRTDKKDLFYDTALGGIRPYASLEIMAQAVGMFASYFNIMWGDGQPLCGKLLSVRNFHCSLAALPVPQEWRVHVHELLRTEEIGSYACSMRPVGGEVVAEVEITVIREHSL